MNAAITLAVAAVLGLQAPNAEPPADPPAPKVATPAERDPVELERDIALLEQAARGRVTLAVRDARLGEVIAAIGKDAGLETRGDWAMLGLIGADADDRIDFAVTDSSPLGAMAALGIQISKDQDRPVVEALGGQVLLTLPLGLLRLRGTATYDVEDLLAPTVALPGPDGAAGPDAASREERLENLHGLILEHVETEQWQEYGGEVGSIGVHDGRLVITATPAMHLAVRQLLDGLREGPPGTAAVDLAVYRLPPAAIVELRTTAGDPRRLASEIARRFADRVVSAPRIVTRIGEKGSITIGSAGAESLSLTIDARRDAERGITVVDVAYSESDGKGRTVQANPTFLVSGHRATEVVITPAAAPDGPSTVLVADVTLRGLERGSGR